MAKGRGRAWYEGDSDPVNNARLTGALDKIDMCPDPRVLDDRSRRMVIAVEAEQTKDPLEILIESEEAQL